jgi:hypothetical protein
VSRVLIIVPTIFIDEFLSQKSIDAIEEAKLALADSSASNKSAPETYDQNSDTIVEPDTAHSSDEEFELGDKEAMIEAAHEIQRQLDAANPQSPEGFVHGEENIKVLDEHGETVLIPAHALDEIEEDEQSVVEETDYSDDGESGGRKRSESNGDGDMKEKQEKPKWKLEKLEWRNSLMRTAKLPIRRT